MKKNNNECARTAYINKCIEAMLPALSGDVVENNRDFDFECFQSDYEIIDDMYDVTGFESDFILIKDLFSCSGQECCNAPIRKYDIMRQLVVIDSLYSTNINRMRVFALEEICDKIWALCSNGSGNHTLGNLISRINDTQALDSGICALFSSSYGYMKGLPAGNAYSLISKYLYFATIACPIDKWGFPIYDRIAKKMMRKVQRFLGIPVTSDMQNKFDIDAYIAGLKSIIETLEKNNPNLWANLPVLKFQLLDYFLWHIGKAGAESYSLLLSKKEVLTCYENGVIVKLPHRIAYWKDVYNKLK